MDGLHPGESTRYDPNGLQLSGISEQSALSVIKQLAQHVDDIPGVQPALYANGQTL
ncbi:MAG: hypothetical protein AAF292_04355 [Pseudomonadota bacterium]